MSEYRGREGGRKKGRKGGWVGGDKDTPTLNLASQRACNTGIQRGGGIKEGREGGWVDGGG